MKSSFRFLPPSVLNSLLPLMCCEKSNFARMLLLADCVCDLEILPKACMPFWEAGTVNGVFTVAETFLLFVAGGIATSFWPSLIDFHCR